jgi:ribosomal protein S12 methylthiotransferase
LRRHGLVRLVEALLRETSIPWIRFLYAYPTTLDEDLLRLMGAEERFCSYLDMPLQHSHGDVLAAMRRGGDAKRYLRLLERARELAPDVFLRSTFIVGFPGETEEQFRDLAAFIEEARFDHLGAFAYSPEQDTPGAALGGRVPKNTQRRRLRQLLEAQKPIAIERRQRLVGRQMTVLVEGLSEESDLLLQGRHHGMAPDIDGHVLINDGTAPAGSLVRVEITEAYANDLVGRIVGAARPEDADRVIAAIAALPAISVDAEAALA